MNQDTIEVTTRHGVMPVHIRRPEDHGPFPLVVLYMDAPGVREALHGHAQRLAQSGYMTALPDLYYRLDPARRPDPQRLRSGDESAFARMAAAVQTLEDADVIEDTGLMIEQLHDDASWNGDGWGCVGFCRGGRVGMRAASEFGGDLIAASLLHPARLVTDEPDSPHLRLGGANAELYLGFGENDHVTPLSTIPPLREQLDRHDIRHRIEVIPGADHGFTMPGMPAYNREAAEQAWKGTLALLEQRMPSPAA
jgi:carboxymethylenebutenolidase